MQILSLSTRKTNQYFRKLLEIEWSILFLLTVIASVGFAMLYSAAGGDASPWALKQMIRFGIGMGCLIGIALIDIRFWFGSAYFFYAASLLLLLIVEIKGFVGMGAQRWIDLGVFKIQPSELIKISLILALARYFHLLKMKELRRVKYLIPPLLMIFVPALLVLKQPDLGTAVVLVMMGGCLFFTSGIRLWVVVSALVAAFASAPILWQFMRAYQKNRVLTFLSPESDPLGTGYHIIQSKIALGSGGLFGKGFLKGTQGRLNFLPEKQTDFIFTLLSEEFGLLGGLFLLSLYCLLLLYGYKVCSHTRTQFGRLVSLGVTSIIFLYVFINMAMVMGLIPVVGVPLPLVSYGGTSMLTTLFGMGLVMSVSLHHNIRLHRPSQF